MMSFKGCHGTSLLLRNSLSQELIAPSSSFSLRKSSSAPILAVTVKHGSHGDHSPALWPWRVTVTSLSLPLGEELNAGQEPKEALSLNQPPHSISTVPEPMLYQFGSKQGTEIT